MAKNDVRVNFIRHLLSVSEKFIDDDRLSPLHISLYYALFHSWNLSKFRNPISVSRNELMRASKIGSANTYTKCLKDLDNWGYIKYKPSYNPHKGSLIYLYKFNNTTDNATDISTDKSSDKGSEKGTDKAPVMAVIPSINNINNTNKLKDLKEDEHTKNSIKEIFFDKISFREKRKKVPQKKEKSPSVQEVQDYFTEHKYSVVEAEKFFNYFESNGWLVGGKTPMKNWKAAARNWMLNAKKFNHENFSGHQQSGTTKHQAGKFNSRAGNLHSVENKNYGEAL